MLVICVIITFVLVSSGPMLRFTVIIPLLLGVSLFYTGWFFYYREDNKFPRDAKTVNKNENPEIRRGREVTSGFLIVAIGTTFFIPTLSLITSYLEQPQDVNNVITWSNGSILVNINYPNPLNIPIKYSLENLTKNLMVTVYHPANVRISFLDLVSPQDSVISTSPKFNNITKKLYTKEIFNMPIYAQHFDEISNKTYNYSLIMGYTDSSSKDKEVKQITIPFEWTIIMKDLPWLNYLWIVMAGVVASRFITFIADTKKEDPIDIDRTESLWIAFTFIIAVIAFASFKENVILGNIGIFNVLASFAFGFGSQKVLELTRVFPGTSVSTPAQVTGLKLTSESNEIKLEWDSTSETDIDHYNIYRGKAPGFIITAQAPTAMSPENSYTDTGLDPDTNYYYRVSAVNKASSIGPHSTEETIKTKSKT